MITSWWYNLKLPSLSKVNSSFSFIQFLVCILVLGQQFLSCSYYIEQCFSGVGIQQEYATFTSQMIWFSFRIRPLILQDDTRMRSIAEETSRRWNNVIRLPVWVTAIPGRELFKLGNYIRKQTFITYCYWKQAKYTAPSGI